MNLAIDENVLAVANDFSRGERGEELICPQATAECQLACVRLLNEARGGIVLIDDRGLVLHYYRRKASMSGQPGSADVFLRHIIDNQYNADIVSIRSIGRSPNFNLDEEIIESKFDLDDRIYIALALSIAPSVVVNAVDSDYSENSDLLMAHGVNVRELCLSTSE